MGATPALMELAYGGPIVKQGQQGRERKREKKRREKGRLAGFFNGIIQICFDKRKREPKMRKKI